MLEKQTNSELNTFDRRDQRIVIANFYWQDLFALGYTTQFNLHYLHDKATLHFDANDFLVRPDPVGVFTPHELNVVYLGWTSSGHIGILNVTHALYQAVGTDTTTTGCVPSSHSPTPREIGTLPVGQPRDLIAFSINRILPGEILASGIGKGYACSV